MEVNKKEKRRIIEDFKKHVSSGEVATFRKYGMQFITQMPEHHNKSPCH